MEFIVGNTRITIFKVDRVKKWIVLWNTVNPDIRFTPVRPMKSYVKTLRRRIEKKYPDKRYKIPPIKLLRQIAMQDLGENYNITLKDAKLLVESWGYGET